MLGPHQQPRLLLADLVIVERPGGDAGRYPRHKQRGHSSDGYNPGLARFVVRQFARGLLEFGKYGSAATDQNPAIARRLKTTRGTLEQLRADHAFDFRQHLGSRRLGHVQPVGGQLELAEVIQREK